MLPLSNILYCMEKRWKVLPKISEEFQALFPEISPIVLQLLFNREITTQKDIDEFLYPDYGEHVHDPFLFMDMEKVCERIFESKEKDDEILVYGDYDADGVCATALMITILQKLGIHPKVYIPFREKEGYGMNMNAVKEIIEKKVKLVITVDCGIANIQEVEEFNKAGIDVIITDHHNPKKELPAAFAIINPKREGEKYPTSQICGTAVAYKVAQALLSERIRKKYSDTIVFPQTGFEKWLLDFVAIGTVTDIMVLCNESRTLLKYGLVVLNKTPRPGLQKLFEVAGITPGKIDTYAIGFQIGPRLNAAGRLDHASTSYELLISDDSEEVKKIAFDLNAKNQERQRISEKMFLEAREQCHTQMGNNVLFVRDDSWMTSLVGLVAGKITGDYHRPSMVIGKNHAGSLVGSGRSVEGFDLTLALEKCKDFLSKYGGHSYACGFTLREPSLYDNFREKFIEIANQSLRKEDLIPQIQIDLETELHMVNWDIVKILEQFEPFGEGNERPKFLISKCQLFAAHAVGNGNKHLKGVVGDSKGTSMPFIGFFLGNWREKLQIGDTIDIVCEPNINEWNGNREIQLKILDVRKSIL